MKFTLLLSFISLFLSSPEVIAGAKDSCHKAKNFKKLCKVHVSELRPTQYAIGSFSIRHKAGKIEKEWAQGELEEHLEDNSNPAIFGPDAKLWIIDGHHFNYALFMSNTPFEKKETFLKVIADYRGKSLDEFKSFMKEKNYVYLKDEQFKPIAFEELPKSLELLKNNPYRSLAWIARKRGWIKKSKTPFAEFQWGEFFKKEGISLTSPFDATKHKKSLKQAKRLSKDSKASALPGFVKN